MSKDKKYIADVGISNLPFPIKVVSKVDPDGQYTIANITINARIMHEFEAGWIDKFIQVLHSHRESIGHKILTANVQDYMNELNASSVQVMFEYPFFVEKVTPVSKEKCLVRYMCTHSVKTSSVGEPIIRFKIKVPAITTYPISSEDQPGGLFGQSSNVLIEIETKKDVFPEDIVAIVDRCALTPVYSFLTEEDQLYLIKKIHSEEKTSVAMTDEIKNALAHNHDIIWYSVYTSNYGMLHSYATEVGTEKSFWIPFSSFE